MNVIAVPRDADVRVNGQYMGTTPTVASIDRNNPGNLLVSKEGYKEQYLSIQKHADAPWWIWDIATCVVPVTLCIPILVDALSGAWFSYDDDVHVKLDALPATSAPSQTLAPSPYP